LGKGGGIRGSKNLATENSFTLVWTIHPVKKHWGTVYSYADSKRDRQSASPFEKG